MLDSSQNYLGATTTTNSSEEGRLKVGVSKKKILKKILKKHVRR
jgi:hypothetical protein